MKIEFNFKGKDKCQEGRRKSVVLRPSCISEKYNRAETPETTTCSLSNYLNDKSRRTVVPMFINMFYIPLCTDDTLSYTISLVICVGDFSCTEIPHHTRGRFLYFLFVFTTPFSVV